MMVDALIIILSAVLVYITVYPLIEWFKNKKEEMEDKKNDHK